MAKNQKKGTTSDGEDTIYFQTNASKSGRNTDNRNTQELDTKEVRRTANAQAQNQGQNGNVYRGNGQNQGYYNNQNGNIYRGNGQNQNYNNQGYYNQGYNQNSNQEGSIYRGSPQSQNGYNQSYNNQGYNNQNGYNQGYNNQNGYNQGYNNQNGYNQGYNQSYNSQNGNVYRGNNQNQGYNQGYNNQNGNVRRGNSQNSGSRNQQNQNARAASNKNQNRNRNNGGYAASAAASKPKKHKKHSLWKKVLKIICIVIVALFLLYSVVALIGIISMNHVTDEERTYTDGSLDASYVKNVLVIGSDTRDPDTDSGRSDSMILISINSRTGEIYLTSIMRDAYVYIPGYGNAKLNAAYSYGGADLLMDTIEYNYEIHIEDYVMFTFEAFVDVIDAVGGVEITISDEEAEAINDILISEVNELMGDDTNDDLLDAGGTLVLNGKQALSYARIRYVGNADFERTERQRTVIEAVIESALSNPISIVNICLSSFSELTTNMSVASLYSYAVLTPFQLIFYDLEQQRIPTDDMYTNATIDGQSVLEVDFDAAIDLLEETIYAK